VNRDPNERAQPDGGAAPDEFEVIISGWRREGDVPEWPDDPEQVRALLEPRTERPAADAPPPDQQLQQAQQPARPADDDDHFVPPEPPPLPRLGPPALVGLVLLTLGVLLLVAPGWLGVPQPYGMPLGLVSLAAGLGWLVLRLWPDPPSADKDGDDDGAVV
jgi:hypothetical protein